MDFCLNSFSIQISQFTFALIYSSGLKHQSAVKQKIITIIILLVDQCSGTTHDLCHVFFFFLFLLFTGYSLGIMVLGTWISTFIIATMQGQIRICKFLFGFGLIQLQSCDLRPNPLRSSKPLIFKTFQLTFSPTTPGWSHFRLVGLLSAILALSGAMMAIAFCVGLVAGINTFCFMAAEVSS